MKDNAAGGSYPEPLNPIPEDCLLDSRQAAVVTGKKLTSFSAARQARTKTGKHINHPRFVRNRHGLHPRYWLSDVRSWMIRQEITKLLRNGSDPVKAVAEATATVNARIASYQAGEVAE